MSQLVRWKVGDFTVECPRAALDGMEAEARAGFHGLMEGGVEVGGILFGERGATGVRVLAWRPVPCDYAAGPHYRLSESDETGLRRGLEAGPTDPELAGMLPVGWYHSQGGGELRFSEEDLSLHRRYFAGDGQVALVLRPDRAGIFVGIGEGVVACAEVESPPASPRPGKISWLWLAAAFALLLAALVWFRAGASGIGLRVESRGEQIDIRWNRNSAAVTRAASAYVEIAERGQRVRIDLNAEQLRSGSVVYQRSSPEGTVRMVIESPESGSVQESARFRATE